MTRILIIAVAVLLVLGGVSTALSPASDRDPGPAIVLDKDPGDDTKSSQGTGGLDAANYDYESESVRDDRSADDEPFTVAHPKPVDAASDEPGDEPADEPGDKPDDKPDDEPDDEPGDEPDDEPDDD